VWKNEVAVMCEQQEDPISVFRTNLKIATIYSTLLFALDSIERALMVVEPQSHCPQNVAHDLCSLTTMEFELQLEPGATERLETRRDSVLRRIEGSLETRTSWR
jgi:hypothetical protein